MTEYRQIIKPLEVWQNVTNAKPPKWLLILQGQIGEGTLLVSSGIGPLDIDPTEWLVNSDGRIAKYTDQQFREQFEPVTPQITVDILTDAVLHGMGIQRIDHREIYGITKDQFPDHVQAYSSEPMVMIDGVDTSDIPEVSAEWFKTAKLSYRGIPLDHQEPIAEDDPRHPNQRATRFRDQLEHLINKHSMENGSDTPDFILAEFLTATLITFDAAVRQRAGWYRHEMKIAELEAQLQAEGEHTAAANARIDEMQRKLDSSLLDEQ